MKSWKITLTDLIEASTHLVREWLPLVEPEAISSRLLKLHDAVEFNETDAWNGPKRPGWQLFAVPWYGLSATISISASLPAQFPMKSVDTAATDGVGLVPARSAMVGKLRAQRFAAPTGDGDRTVPPMRLSLEAVLR